LETTSRKTTLKVFDIHLINLLAFRVDVHLRYWPNSTTNCISFYQAMRNKTCLINPKIFSSKLTRKTNRNSNTEKGMYSDAWHSSQPRC